MASRFATAADRLDAAVDEMFGEAVRIIPRSGGRISSAAADPDRPEREVVAVIVMDPSDVKLMSERREGRSAIGATQATAPGPALTLSAAVAAGLGYALRDGDIIVRLDGGARFRVVGPPETSERGQMSLSLAQERGPQAPI